MPRSGIQGANLFRLKQYLLENTDIDRSVGVSDISKHFEETDVFLDRKTIHSSILALIDLDDDIEIDIVKNKGKATEYKVVKRYFDLDELQLIIDCVQTSKFLTQEYANYLTDLLKYFASEAERKLLNRRCFIVDRIRNMNKDAFYGINEIHQAISVACKIKFTYTTHDKPNQKKINTRVVSPITLIWNDGYYYLFATNGKRYRVDRMSKIRVLENEPSENMDKHDKKKIREESTAMFSVFRGKMENVILKFANNFTDVVIDRFGNKTRMIPIDDNHFSISVNVEVNPQFLGWLFGMGKGVKILSPDNVIEKMKKHLSDVMEMYQDDAKMDKDVVM